MEPTQSAIQDSVEGAVATNEYAIFEVMFHDRNKAINVEVTKTHVLITLIDDRIIGVPLSRLPKLESATEEQRAKYDIVPWAIHWDDLDIGIDIPAMLSGRYGGYDE